MLSCTGAEVGEHRTQVILGYAQSNGCTMLVLPLTNLRLVKEQHNKGAVGETSNVIVMSFC